MQPGAPDGPGQMSAGEVRERALGGAVIVLVRNILVRLVTLGGTLVLARLLTPHDFGVVAIGMTLLTVGGTVAEAGMGAALIRRPEAPDREELETVLGFQLAITLPITLVAVAAALPFGEVGQVTAVMIFALPILAFRTPGVILLERDLLYQRVTQVELRETVVQYTWSVATVAAGLGVWGLATGSIVRAIVGSALMVRASPTRILRPRLDWSRMRPIMRFGAAFQAAGLVSLTRDQGMNVGTAAIAGVATLGLWTIAFRILQIPFLLFHALWRVSYPTMSRLIAAGEAPGRMVERGIGLVNVVTGAILCALAGAAPALIVAVFGAKWGPVSDVIPWACAGLMVSAPVSVAATGYLYASGDAGIVLRAVVAHSVAWLAVSFALLPELGVEALGIGWLAAGLVDIVILGGAVQRRLKISVVRAVLIPTLLATAAGAAGWFVADAGDQNLLFAAGGAVAAEAVYLAGLLVFRRQLLQETISAAGRGIAASMARA